MRERDVKTHVAIGLLFSLSRLGFRCSCFLYIDAFLSRGTMFVLAGIIGFTGIITFLFGISGLLQRNFLVAILFFDVLGLLRVLFKSRLQFYKPNCLETVVLCLLALQLFVALFAAISPEFGFDALWYHLTLPKMFLEQGKILYLPSSLFLYSVMPSLTEMLYLLALAFSNEITAKIIHFGFGLLSVAATYALSRRFLGKPGSLFSVLILSSNLVFAWEMTTAYVDLARTWFETLALLAILLFQKERKQMWLFISGLMLGFAISTKIVAVGSILLFITILVGILCVRFRQIVIFLLPAILLPLQWLIFAAVSTGNPVYPLFSSETAGHIPQLSSVIGDTVKLFFYSSDLISPIYVILIPLIVLYWKKMWKGSLPIRILLVYCLGALILWMFSTSKGGSRFILPYLPAWSILVAFIIERFLKEKVQRVLVGSVLFVSILTIGYRGLASLRYTPVIFGRETKQDFLLKHLDFSYGDFFDVDSSIQRIVRGRTVLVYGGHNFFYADFPFVHVTMTDDRTTYNLALVINTETPSELSLWTLIYENTLTSARLYQK